MPTPLFDAFKRAEVERDVRMLAARGELAPAAHEQLLLLILLVDDPDPEIGVAAEATLGRIPVDSLKAVLAQADVPDGVREFFAGRGIFPSETAVITVPADQPLVDGDPAVGDVPADEAARSPMGMMEQLARMTFPQRLKAAMKGSREIRAVLIRDSNRLIAATVLSSAKVNDAEVAGFARMANVSEDVLRAIGKNRAWMKSYAVVIALTKNPKTPLALSLSLLGRLNSRDLQSVSIDRNIPESLRMAARRKLDNATSRS